jgi:hypothetical protein
MELSSHVIFNLNQWVEDGLINIEQREAFAQLMENAMQDTFDYGLADAVTDNVAYDNGHEDGYDSGWSDGFEAGKPELETALRDEWFEQGWAAALAEHGIEE